MEPVLPSGVTLVPTQVLPLGRSVRTKRSQSLTFTQKSNGESALPGEARVWLNFQFARARLHERSNFHLSSAQT